MQNGVSLLSGWKYCEGDTKKFFKYINIQDKLILYKWVASNSLVLCNDMEILSAISLDWETCNIVFGLENERVWKTWEYSGKDPVKFVNMMNVKDKCCLSLWYDDV